MSRRLIVVFLAGCASHAGDIGQRYLDDAEFRRSELAASLVNHANDYSRLRLDHYAEWEDLPVWNPRVEGSAIDLDRSLVEIGRDAFVRYPAQLLPIEKDDPRLTNLVDVELVDGSHRVGYTCATCHSFRGVPGAANVEVDFGRILGRAWGPGRADVSTQTGDDPVRIPDLRATKYQTYLQVNATVEQRNIASLALRIETLLVTGHGQIVRPPREIALGLATYLWSLAPPPPRAPATAAELRGQRVFAASCAKCHASPNYAGRTPLEGADSRDRGTGMSRVPSLVGLSQRRAEPEHGLDDDPDLRAFLATL